ARVMSLAYYAGGFPMVRKCGEDERNGNADGWYLFPDGSEPPKLSGSRVWNAHTFSWPSYRASPEANLSPLPRNPNRTEEGGNLILDLTLAQTYLSSALLGFIAGQPSNGVDNLPPEE